VTAVTPAEKAWQGGASVIGSRRESASARGWRPLLEGSAAEQARSALDAIAASLAASLPAGDDPTAAPLARHVALESGRAGLALFYASLARSTGDQAAELQAERLLTSALDTAPQVELGPSLWGGIAGLDWAATHLDRLGLTIGDRAEAFGRWASDRLATELHQGAGAGPLSHYDLIGGLVGVGLAALERLPEPSAAALVERIVVLLDERAERLTDGVTWWTPPEHTGQAERMPHGWYNLGLAHGVPGVVAFLGLVCAANVATTPARPLLDGAVGWLLAQRHPFANGAHFPRCLGTGIEPAPGRLSWCYGDPGTAAALLVAARAVGEPAWEREAIALALAAAERTPETAGVVDASLCHGAIGVGHIFNRLWQATGEARLAEAARFWLARGLAMRQPAGRLGGFHAVIRGEDGQPARRIAFRGLLMGAAGLGLALLAATSDVEPAWDRILLLR
jgi:lantibiotic modifying enzyme